MKKARKVLLSALGFSFCLFASSSLPESQISRGVSSLTPNIQYASEKYTLSFSVESIVIQTKQVEYGTAIGAFPEVAEREGYSVKWTIGEESIRIRFLG